MKDMSNQEVSRLMIDKEDCVLLLIDVQEKLLPLISKKEELVENTVRLLKFARIIGMPVLVTEQENLGPTVEPLKAEIESCNPIMKIDFNACRCGEFTEAFEKVGRNTAIVTGIESHICITQTVLHLLPDYNVHVIRDAVSSRTRDNWETAINRMGEAGAVISSTEMVMYELLVRAGTDEFRQTLKLVK